MDGVVAQPFCESEKKKACKRYRGSDPRTGTLKRTTTWRGEFWRLKSMDALTVSVGFFAMADVRPASERQADYCGQSEAPEHDS